MKSRKKMEVEPEKLTDLPKPEKWQVGFETYQSPFTFRYGTDPMRRIWSQEHFWLTVRDIWIAVAEVQSEVGLVTREQLEDLKAHRYQLSVERIFQFERHPTLGTGHDVAAAIAEFSEVAPIGGRILHQGLTSEDVLSNAEIMQVRDSFGLVRGNLVALLKAFGGQIGKYNGLECIGVSHWQAAEPTTMGYRFSKYAENSEEDLGKLDDLLPRIKAKGIKGPVGTRGSIANILGGRGMTAAELERKVMAKLNLPYFSVSGQTYPRRTLFTIEEVLSSIGSSLHEFSFNLQFLQSSFVDEVSEPRRKGQVGSSAMPFKQNPVNSESVSALTEVLPGQLFSAWMTKAFDSLERTLRDSAGKRIWLPESFLIADEALTRTERVVKGLEVHENMVKTNLRRFASNAATEIILGKLEIAGMDRKEAHEIILGHAEKVVEIVRSGELNPMEEFLMADSRITGLIGERVVEEAFIEIFSHIGDAKKEAARVARRIARIK